MSYHRLLFCLLVVCFVTVKSKNTSTDLFGFPAEESSINQNRIPIFVPEKCPGNQLLYPGDQEADWICDCSPGHVYHPPTDECYAILRKGPCKMGEHLIMPKPEYMPKCKRNPCNEGSALYNGQCYKLNAEGGPCKPVVEAGGIFDINPATLEADCIDGHDWITNSNNLSKCPIGSKRDNINRCRNPLKTKTTT